MRTLLHDIPKYEPGIGPRLPLISRTQLSLCCVMGYMEHLNAVIAASRERALLGEISKRRQALGSQEIARVPEKSIGIISLSHLSPRVRKVPKLRGMCDRSGLRDLALFHRQITH